MTIHHMYTDPETGELRVVLDDKVVALSPAEGQLFGPNNIVEKTVSNHGKDDPLGINVRTTYQTEQLLPASTIVWNEAKVKELNKVVASYRDRFLMMLDCILYIEKEIQRCDKEFSKEGGRVRLPQVEHLQDRAESFLLSGKKALSDMSEILVIFFDYPKPNHDFVANYKWAKQNLGEDHAVTRVIADHVNDDNWPKRLVEMRNRIEHSRESYWFKVNNIAFDPVSKMMIAPSWWTNEENEPYDLLSEMRVFLQNALVLSEDLVGASIKETPSTPLITVGRLPAESINPELPLSWKTFVKGLPSQS